MKRAFSLIEVLLVVSILAVLVGMTLPLGMEFYSQQQLDSYSKEVVQLLRKAQVKAMALENNDSYGLYFTNNSYTLFRGSSFVSRKSLFDEKYDFPQIISFSGILEVVFSKYEGTPSVTGNIIISNNKDSKTININEIGRISLQ